MEPHFLALASTVDRTDPQIKHPIKLHIKRQRLPTHCTSTGYISRRNQPTNGHPGSYDWLRRYGRGPEVRS
jgi:hypothetical protein